VGGCSPYPQLDAEGLAPQWPRVPRRTASSPLAAPVDGVPRVPLAPGGGGKELHLVAVEIARAQVAAEGPLRLQERVPA
jgi:hypothetical protein